MFLVKMYIALVNNFSQRLFIEAILVYNLLLFRNIYQDCELIIYGRKKPPLNFSHVSS
jgi:hypothetical protein